MKIAILDIDDLKNPHWGSGQAKVTREIGTRLAKKHKVVVYSSKYPKWHDYKVNNIVYKHIGLGSNNAFLNNIVYLLTLPMIVPNIRCDVMIENFTAPISTCFSPLFTKSPVIGLTSFFSAEKMHGKYKIPFELVEKVGMKFYQHVVALNNSYLEKAKKLNPKLNVKVIPNGVDDIYFKMPTREKSYGLFIGRLDLNQKGLDILVKAFAKISDQIKDELWIMGAGSSEDEKSLQELILKYKLEKRIKLLGRKGGAEKDQIFSEAKYIVFPSRYEGQSLSALESIALGKPIICFDIEGFDWLDKETALKIPAFKVNKYAQGLVSLSKNKRLRNSIGTKARQLATSFSWDKGAKAYEEYLQVVVKSKK